MKKWRSSRLDKMGSAIFAEMETWKEQAKMRGHDIIDLGIGSPDQPPSEAVMLTLAEAVQEERHYGYPSSQGSLKFREVACQWLQHRFGIHMDAQREIVTLMGSQDGLAHLALSITDPGDVALVPDPGYPIYEGSLVLAGVEAYRMPLKEVNQFLPDFDAIPDAIRSRAKMMILNFPSNPVAATADRAFYEKALQFAREHEILLVHDAAYSEMAFDGFRPMSIFELDDAYDHAVEFHSMSKSFNMAGCRIAFMVGCEPVIEALKVVKSNIDYGVFEPIQIAAAAALEADMKQPFSVGRLYEGRRNALVDGLRRIGFSLEMPKATMFVWARIPKGWTSRQISREILLHTGVVVIPGDAFGEQGEGYVRIALVQPEEVLHEATARIGTFLQGGTNSLFGLQ
ncbi:aminotransferase class I/II-fold pyridoxal phosphate-dependent enzyme [Marinicrinis sediminis]|uniref:Aminotransferase n=1 Tax=Marinicrinis sediminis TaxID=1652465 RepID=A0ABW5R964_9BACL